MKSIIQVAVVIVAFTSAGCVSNDEAAQLGTVAAAASSPIFGEMHAAIPASKINGNVFEY